jgi:NitT/TauT family transport system substrate-binding protein
MREAIMRALHQFGALSVAIALAASSQASAQETFRVGITAPTVNMLPLWMARDAGLFRMRGLNVEIVTTDGGSRGLAMVGQGRLAVMTVGLSATIDANTKGGDYRLIASGANTMSFRFFGARGVSVGSLRGKTIGVSAFGSESDVAATMALRQLGLTRQDVQVVESGGTLDRLEALRAGRIAATALNEPADSEANRSGLPLLVDLKANLPWIFTALVVNRGSIATNRATLLNFLRAYGEGIHLALSDEARAKRVLASEFRQFSPEILQITYEDFTARVPRDAAPAAAGIETMLLEFPRLGIAIKSANAADYVDQSLIEELRREGFFAAMQAKYRTQ